MDLIIEDNIIQLMDSLTTLLATATTTSMEATVRTNGILLRVLESLLSLTAKGASGWWR